MMASRTTILRLRPITLHRPLCRSYHSYDHPPPPGPFNPTEELILSSALLHVPTHGFTHSSLSLGARDAGYLDVSTNLFPKGAFSLVQYHLVRQRLALAQHQHIIDDSKHGKPAGVGSKVKALVWERLMGNKDIIHRWQEALALMSLPSNIPPAIHELAALSDEIWFLSKDKSVDSSWYTKRASLSAIYASTELFMTNDQSLEFTETRQFLDRRFEDSFKLGRAVGSVGQWVGFTGSAALNVLRSKGIRI